MQENGTILEIDLQKLLHNLQFLKSKIKENTFFLAVIKAFAYGSDAVKVGQFLEGKVDYLAVAYTDEGIQLREAGIKTPILVFHPLPQNFDKIIDYQLEPGIYSLRALKLFLKYAGQRNLKKLPIHLKFNTGLNRLGFSKDTLSSLGYLLKEQNHVYIKSIYSHLAASEDAEERIFTQNQIHQFTEICDKLYSLLSYKPLHHICNTSGLLNYPEAHFDMVRAGIGLYGFGNGIQFQKELQPIATLKTTISQIHQLKKEDSVGYNRNYTADSETRIAVLPLGHADGINRIYGNGKGYVWINNQCAPIVGSVCMDMIMVNVSQINCQEGDEVVVFDSSRNASTLAENAGTISYELITSMSRRIKRVYK